MPSFATVRGPIQFEQHGSRADEPLLLINGLGQQLIHWPRAFIDALTAAGLRVVTFDNRDAGLSFRVRAAPVQAADVFRAALKDGGAPTPPYALADMAADAAALLDHLGQAGAHVVGLSLGGMIAQRFAIHSPQRAFSLATILAGVGPFPLPEDDQLRAALIDPAPPKEDKAIVERAIAGAVRLGGAHHDSASVGFGRFAQAARERACEPAGTARQLLAGIADGDRAALLQGLRLPTLAILGDADPLLPPAEGERIAAAMPNARVEAMQTLGHDLPEPLIPTIAEGIVALARSARARR